MKQTTKDRKEKKKCPICEVLGGHSVIGCVGDVFICPLPKIKENEN